MQLRSNGRELRKIRGPWTDARVDRTARMRLTGLAPGREYDASVWFASADGIESTRQELRFRTAPIHAAAQSVIWSGDTCGQGWGIDRARGGLTTYRAMLGLRPDLFVHVGDTIYGDEPMSESVRADDGSLWVNELTEEVTTVAETLAQFRGRHRYPLPRRQRARVLRRGAHRSCSGTTTRPATTGIPGETIDDERYTERRADVLAIRGRRAWQEYQPVPVTRLVPSDGDGFVPTRLYRQVPRGQHLDLFCLDMRSYRGPNPRRPAPRRRPGILGREQEAWLIDSLRRSTATWKVISADQPLSAPSTRTTDLDGPANGDDGLPLGREPEMARVLSAIKRHDVRNVVWITTDVHYTAAHHYSPERAAYTDFEPFWEFVSGPLAASPFWTKDDRLDGTFGPRVAFSKGEDTDRLDDRPAPGQPVLRPPGDRRHRRADGHAVRRLRRRALVAPARAGAQLMGWFRSSHLNHQCGRYDRSRRSSSVNAGIGAAGRTGGARGAVLRDLGGRRRHHVLALAAAVGDGVRRP